MNILLKNNQILNKAHDNYQRFIEDDAVLTMIRRREINQRQIITDLKTAEQRGKQEGKQEGLQVGMQMGKQEGLQVGLLMGKQEGKKEEKIELAKNGIIQGLDTAVLAKLTGLSYEEIEAIRNDVGTKNR